MDRSGHDVVHVGTGPQQGYIVHVGGLLATAANINYQT